MNQPSFTSAFSILTLFTVLVIIGLALVPKLQLRLLPSRYEPSVYVYFGMRDASAIVVDNEVTSKLEGAFSRIPALKKLESRTRAGGGSLVLRFHEDADMDAVRFEVATIVRQLYPQLPEGVSYPYIGMSSQEDEDRPERLMSFTLTGKDPNPVVGQWAEEHLVPAFSEVAGVHEVAVYGAFPYEWELTYRRSVLDKLGLKPSDIRKQIRQYYQTRDLGGIYEESTGSDVLSYIPVKFQGMSSHTFAASDLQISHKGRLFRLTDLVEVKRQEAAPSHYERINGLHAINILVTARGSANFISSANALKQEALRLATSLPDGYSLQMTYDASEFISKELQNILWRIAAAVGILLVFVFLVSRSWRYLAVIGLSILINIVVAFIAYYYLGLTIHIYSLAGIAISLGIIMDNTIVMTDQLRHGKGISVIRAIVAATLTTIGSLVVVFFLDAQTQLKLVDFTLAMVINLSVSLVITFFFIPALMQQVPLRKRPMAKRFRKSRRIVRFSHLYARLIYWLKGKRWLLWLILILGFGLPTFLMPNHLKGEAFYVRWYNEVFGSAMYTEHIRPVSDVAVGGVLRLFLDNTKGKKFNRSNDRTVLHVAGVMDDGTTLEQTNAVFGRIENFLLQYEEIEQFNTSIRSPSAARISVQFTQEAEASGFPHQLKSEVERFCIDLGSADWKISGVGRAFDNSLNEARRNNRMVLYGYNLDQLKGYAAKLSDYLKEIQRVDDESIFINGRATYEAKIRREYELDFDLDYMRRTGISAGGVLSRLQQMSADRDRVMAVSHGGSHEQVYLTEAHATVPDLWGFYHRPLHLTEERFTKLHHYGDFVKKRRQELINKENMQYTMVVEFDFIGSWGQQKYFLGQVMDRLEQQLPIGYSVKTLNYSGGRWGKEDESNKRLWLVLLVVVIIYFVSAVVFGSLIQPLMVILLIPVSFMGAFLTFYLFDLPFDEGGFAALILLSGLTVNSVIYILNDLNSLRKQYPRRTQEQLYLKAYHQKIIPIVLTILSTALGLVPFLIEGSAGVFWTSLSAGTIGGLIASMLGIWGVLPVFVKRSVAKRNNR
ncbi:efflux RND transporter permease subunit [Marinoscillum furvescens]|uniref:Multidrug efflux pump subunit AcrB n=1 Tax=Marinoscillum furvescens DSM 4134 TaxID=1122208 RepID=A0A3D9L206_MARFU|nr:efflux RND transporter permease subunit [Marinoscillum furvescens]RED98405.1 multidrug efflux pump subunit AcrB [Marinoscillum furvescens DSM 4134]